MNYPVFYDPSLVGTLFEPRVDAAVQAGIAANLSTSATDATRTALLLIDPQADFIHIDGALSVPGAVTDTQRTIEWIFQHTAAITEIIVSLDSHVPQQIFSPSWWVNRAGKSPNPFTVITSDDLRNGTWSPVFEVDWSLQYVQQLEETARKQLMIWPYHTLIGTPGHSITPALYEAIAFHAAARSAQPNLIIKGTLPIVEHYSIFEPEVKVDGMPDAGLNRNLLEHIATFDRVFVAGQAKSHCVLESVTSMMRYFDTRPEIISRINLLTDAMSSVVSPGIDFEQIANATFEQFAAHGLNLRTTTDKL